MKKIQKMWTEIVFTIKTALRNLCPKQAQQWILEKILQSEEAKWKKRSRTVTIWSMVKTTKTEKQQISAANLHLLM